MVNRVKLVYVTFDRFCPVFLLNRGGCVGWMLAIVNIYNFALGHTHNTSTVRLTLPSCYLKAIRKKQNMTILIHTIIISLATVSNIG